MVGQTAIGHEHVVMEQDVTSAGVYVGFDVGADRIARVPLMLPLAEHLSPREIEDVHDAIKVGHVGFPEKISHLICLMGPPEENGHSHVSAGVTKEREPSMYLL